MNDVSIADNIARVQDQIATACARVNRNPDEITLVAVSKKKPAEAVLAALDAGLQHFGENRVEEATDKIPLVNQRAVKRPIWHMIGHIQSRKANTATSLFDVVESVDRLKIARKLSDIASEANRKLPIMIEVNISGEVSKYGFDVTNWQSDETIKQRFWENVQTLSQLSGLEIRGLMTMAPFVEDVERTRSVFRRLAELREALRDDFDLDFPDLSMGMTNDFPIAIEEGATIVRIGRAIFGERS